MNKTPAMLDLEAKLDIELKEYLSNKYQDDEMTIRQIAEEVNVNTVTLKSWFKRLGIKTRDRSEASLLRFKGYSKEERSSITSNAHKAVAKHIAEGTFWLGGRTSESVTEDERRRISERMTKNNPMHNEVYASKMRKSMEQVLRDRATPQELRFKEGIESRGLFPKFQHAEIKSVLDFAFIDNKIGIEIDGHIHKAHPEVVKKDLLRDSALEKSGWRIIRILNKDVDERLEEVLDAVIRKVVITDDDRRRYRMDA